MRFIKLIALLWLCQACSSSQSLITHESRFYGYSNGELVPLERVEESTKTQEIRLNAEEITIKNSGVKNAWQSVNSQVGSFAYQKIWGTYLWICIEKRFDGAHLGAQVIEIFNDLTCKVYYHSHLKRKNRNAYTSKERTENSGRLIWIKGNTYLLTLINDSGHCVDNYPVKINTRSFKYMGIEPYSKTRALKSGMKLQKVTKRKNPDVSIRASQTNPYYTHF